MCGVCMTNKVTASIQTGFPVLQHQQQTIGYTRNAHKLQSLKPDLTFEENLMAFVMDGDLKTFQTYLQTSRQRIKSGWHPAMYLSCAARDGRLEIFKWICKEFHVPYIEKDALERAVEHNQHDVVEWIQLNYKNRILSKYDYSQLSCM